MAYNSQFTGAQIDEAIADVRSNKDAWNGKQDVILASGAAVGDLIKVKAVDARGKPTAWAVAVAGTDYLTEAPVTSVNGETGAVKVREVPSVTAADNGKFLRVVSGAWAAVEIANAAESQIAVFVDITDAEQITEALNGLTISNWSLARICKAQDGCLAEGLVILPFAYPAATEDYTGTKTKRESSIDYIILELRYAVARTVDVDGAQCKYSTSAGKRLSSVSLDASVPHTMQLKSGGAAVASFLILPYLSGEQS